MQGDFPKKKGRPWGNPSLYTDLVNDEVTQVREVHHVDDVFDMNAFTCSPSKVLPVQRTNAASS